MLSAIASPLKPFLVAALALGAVGAYAVTHRPVTHRLALHAPVAPNSTYLSAWYQGDAEVTFPDGELHGFTFEVTADMDDGCRWMGIETMFPIDDHTFSYDYRERVLSCEPGATPAKMTPRVGYVTVLD